MIVVITVTIVIIKAITSKVRIWKDKIATIQSSFS